MWFREHHGNTLGTPLEHLKTPDGNTGEHTFLWEHPRIFVDYIVLARTFVTLAPPRGCGTVRGGRRGGGGGGPKPAQGGPGSRLHRGGGAGRGRDAPPETRLDAREFAAKSKTARRFGAPGRRAEAGWGETESFIRRYL